jgi:hypothetical protein
VLVAQVAWRIGSRIIGCTQDGPNAIMLSVKSVRTADPELPGSVRYSFDIDVGEFDLGHRLIARSITLRNDRLFFEYAASGLLRSSRGQPGWSAHSRESP